MVMEFLDTARLREAAADLGGESDRAAPIVGASVVERELTLTCSWPASWT
jgi:hypothetical protein